MSVVVRLKANECYQELLRYLFSYIKLISIRLFARVSGLCVSATDNGTIPGFVLIVLLTILLWSYRSGRIADRFALMALIALSVSLVVSLIALL